MLKTIKSKFIVLSLVVIILSIGIPIVFLLNQVERNFHERSVLMIEAAIDLMIDGLNNSMMTGDEKNVQKIVEQISNKHSIDHIRIFNEEGKIKYGTITQEIGENITDIEPGHIEKEISNISDRQVYLDKKTDVYKAIQPILVEERCQSCHTGNKIIAYLDVDTDFTKAEIKYYTGSLHLLIFGVVLIILLALGYYLIFNNLINKPLNECRLALDDIEDGNLDIKLSVKGDDEFSVLHNHFNNMLDELKYSREKIDELHYEQLQRADKMVTLGELTATMAHDINNHSAIIMSRADFLLLEAENNFTKKDDVEDLKVINNQIEKISKITGNILKHSKKLSKDFTTVNLVEIVKNSIDMLEPLIKKRNVFIEREFSINEAKIIGDANQLEQVILNLVGNALDALESGGKLKIKIAENSENKIQLFVKDNGMGIDEESINKIFSPFYTKKEADKGTGLGLYIVQNICKNHNAEVKCESTKDIGTTFTITFNGGVNNG